MRSSVTTSEPQKMNLSVPEAADRAGISPRAAWMKIYRGQFPYRRWGKKIIVPRAELEKFLSELPGVTAEEALARSAM